MASDQKGVFMKSFKNAKKEPWMIEPPISVPQPFEGKMCACYDIEVYPDYFCCVVIGPKLTPKTYTLENLDEMINDLSNRKLVMVGFNNLGYDDIVMKYIFKNAGRIDHDAIFRISKKIIFTWRNNKDQEYWDLWRYDVPWAFSFDTFLVPKPQIGLKERATMRHAVSIVDLPYSPDYPLGTQKKKDEVAAYCVNDVRETVREFMQVQEHLILRKELSAMYPNADVISKHDAGVCEEIITKEYCRLSGMAKKYLQGAKDAPGKKIDIADCIPHWADFKTPRLDDYEAKLAGLSGQFVTDEQRKILSDQLIVGDLTINVGRGGLHSVDEPLILEPGKGEKIVEIDVASYYPNLIRTLDLTPKHLGKHFNEILSTITENRLEHKRNGDKLVSNALKIVINSAFGKTGNQWSIMFDELVQLQVTIGGQLGYLMLIERLQAKGIKIISVNTDGILVHLKGMQQFTVNKICKQWEQETDLELEQTVYKKYIRRDVNNYLAVLDSGYTKGKGIFKTMRFGDTKEKQRGKAEIIVDALVAHFLEGKPAADSVMECRDLRKFVYYGHVSMGSRMVHHQYEKGSDRRKIVPIQGTSRWYISKDRIKCDESGFYPSPGIGNVVKVMPMTDDERSKWREKHRGEEHPNDWMKEIHDGDGYNSRIINDFPNKFPEDLDRVHYLTEILKRIKEIEG
jgi:hypothetical protein